MDTLDSDMTPDRRLRVRFNQVSDESPFREIQYGQDDNTSDEAFDKVGNITPERRAEMGELDPDYKPWRPVYGGLNRVSDPSLLVDRFRQIEAHERRRADNSSPYRHMSTFQATLQARGGLNYQNQLKRSQSTLERPNKKDLESPRRRGRNIRAPQQNGVRSAQRDRMGSSTQLGAETSKMQRMNLTQTVNVLGGEEPDHFRAANQGSRMQRSFTEQFKGEAAGKASGWFATASAAVSEQDQPLQKSRTSVPEHFQQPLALQDKKYGAMKSKQKQNEISQNSQLAPPSFRQPEIETATNERSQTALDQLTSSQAQRPVLYYDQAMASTEPAVEWPTALPGQVMEPVMQTLDSPDMIRLNEKAEPLPTAHSHVIKSARHASQQHMFQATPIYGRVSQAVLRDYTYKKTSDLEAKYNVSDKVATLPGYEEKPPVSIDMSQYVPDANKKLYDLVSRADEFYRKQKVSELAMAMIAACDAQRQKRQVLLNGYITYCAMMVQRLFRGYMDRKYYGPFLIKLGGSKAGRAKFEALCAGWRVRAIMGLREVKKRAENIRDHDRELQKTTKTPAEIADLRRSRRSTVLNFLHLLKTLLRDGQWTLRVERVMRKGTYHVPENKAEEAQMLRKLSAQKSIPNMSKMGYDSNRRTTQPKPARTSSPDELLAKRAEKSPLKSLNKSKLAQPTVVSKSPSPPRQRAFMAPASSMQAQVPTPVRKQYMAEQVHAKPWNGSPVRDSKQTEYLNFKRRMSYQPNVRKRVTTHEVLGYQNDPDAILPHSKQRQAFRVQEYMDNVISDEYKEGGMNVLLPAQVRPNEAGYVGHFIASESATRKPFTPSTSTKILLDKAKSHNFNKTSTFQQAMKISQGLAEAIKVQSKQGTNPYLVGASPSNASSAKRDMIKDKLKSKYSQSAAQSGQNDAFEADGSTRGQTEQLKNFMLDQMLSENGKTGPKATGPAGNPYLQATGKLSDSQAGAPSNGSSQMAKKEVRFEGDGSENIPTTNEYLSSLPAKTETSKFSSHTDQKEGGNKTESRKTTQGIEARSTYSLATTQIARPSGLQTGGSVQTETYFEKTIESSASKPIVTQAEMQQMELPEVPSPESNFALHPEKVTGQDNSPVYTPAKTLTLSDVESPVSSVLIKPQKIASPDEKLAEATRSVLEHDPFSIKSRQYPQVGTISELGEKTQEYNYQAVVTSEGPEVSDPVPERVSLTENKYTRLPQMSGLSPALGSPDSYILRPQQVQAGSEIKVYDRKMTSDNALQAPLYDSSDLMSDTGFRIKPTHVKTQSSDGNSPDTAFSQKYMLPAQNATTEKEEHTPPQSIGNPYSALGTSPLQNVDHMSLRSKSSFGIQPKKVAFDLQSSPFGQMPDDVSQLSAMNKVQDEGYSLGDRLNPVSQAITSTPFVEMRVDDFTSLRAGPNLTNIAIEDTESKDEPETAKFAGRAKSALEKRLDDSQKKSLSASSGHFGENQKSAYTNKYLWNTAVRGTTKKTISTNSSSKAAKVSPDQINVTAYLNQIPSSKDELLVKPPKVNKSLNEELLHMEMPSCYIGPDGVIIDDTAIVIKNSAAVNQEVDAIVNPTDNRLQRCSDKMNAIGGQKMARESKAWLAKYGEVPTGGSAYTSASQRPNQYIIHTVWPSSQLGSPRSVERLVHSAVVSMLEMAAFLGCTSIGVPAGPSMISGLTHQRFAQLLLETCIKWASRHRGTVKQIWLCSTDSRMIHFFTNSLQKLKARFGSQDAPAIMAPQVQGSSSPSPKKKTKKTNKKRLASYMGLTEGFANKALKPDRVSTQGPKITKSGVKAQMTNVSRIATLTELEKVGRRSLVHQLRASRDDPSFEKFINSSPKPSKRHGRK